MINISDEARDAILDAIRAEALALVFTGWVRRGTYGGLRNWDTHATRACLCLAMPPEHEKFS
mgnify:CR=1 FL=1